MPDAVAPSAPGVLSAVGWVEFGVVVVGGGDATTSVWCATTCTAARVRGSRPRWRTGSRSRRGRATATRGSRPAATTTGSPPRTRPATSARPRTRRRRRSATRVAPSAPGTLSAVGSVGKATLSWAAATDNVGVARYNVHRGTSCRLHPQRRQPDRAAEHARLHRHDQPRQLLLQGHRRGRGRQHRPRLERGHRDRNAPTRPRPSAPTALTAPVTGATVNLSWTGSTDDVAVLRYNVHRGTSAGFTPSAANRIAQPTGTSYADSGLATGSYFYKVTAEDAAGNISAASNEASRHRRRRHPAQHPRHPHRHRQRQHDQPRLGRRHRQRRRQPLQPPPRHHAAASPPAPPTGSRNRPGSATATPTSPPAPTSTSSPPKTPPATSARSATPPPPPSPTPPHPAPPPSPPTAAPAKPPSAGQPPPTTSPSPATTSTAPPPAASPPAPPTESRNPPPPATPTPASAPAPTTTSSPPKTPPATSAPPQTKPPAPSPPHPSPASSPPTASTPAPAPPSPTNPAPATTAPSPTPPGPAPRNGKYGNALTFNGTNATATIPDTNSLDLTTGMTLEAWVRPTNLGNNYRTVLMKEAARQHDATGSTPTAPETAACRSARSTSAATGTRSARRSCR